MSKRWLLVGIAVAAIGSIAVWVNWLRSPYVCLTFLGFGNMGNERHALLVLENLSDDSSIAYAGYSPTEPLLSWRRPPETGWTDIERADGRDLSPFFEFPLAKGEKRLISMPLRSRDGSAIAEPFLVNVAVTRQASAVVLQLNKVVLPLVGRQFRDYAAVKVRSPLIVP